MNEASIAASLEYRITILRRRRGGYHTDCSHFTRSLRRNFAFRYRPNLTKRITTHPESHHQHTTFRFTIPHHTTSVVRSSLFPYRHHTSAILASRLPLLAETHSVCTHSQPTTPPSLHFNSWKVPGGARNISRRWRVWNRIDT